MKYIKFNAVNLIGFTLIVLAGIAGYFISTRNSGLESVQQRFAEHFLNPKM